MQGRRGVQAAAWKSQKTSRTATAVAATIIATNSRLSITVRSPRQCIVKTSRFGARLAVWKVTPR